MQLKCILIYIIKLTEEWGLVTLFHVTILKVYMRVKANVGVFSFFLAPTCSYEYFAEKVCNRSIFHGRHSIIMREFTPLWNISSFG
jgi:hypothetical protein